MSIYRKLFLLILFIVLFHSSFGNLPKERYGTYLTAFYLGFGAGYPWMSGSNVNFILSNDFGGSLSYRSTTFDAKNAPSDYDASFLCNLIIDRCTPQEELKSFSIQLMKVYRNPFSKRRLGWEFGPALVVYKETLFTPYTRVGSVLSAKGYTLNYKSHKTAGAILRAKVDFPITKGLGLELAIVSNINRYYPYAGFEVFLNAGVLRERQ